MDSICVHSETIRDTGICPVCRQELSDPIERCERCLTAHHSECWTLAAGCSRFGCAPATGTRPACGKAARLHPGGVPPRGARSRRPADTLFHNPLPEQLEDLQTIAGFFGAAAVMASGTWKSVPFGVVLAALTVALISMRQGHPRPRIVSWCAVTAAAGLLAAWLVPCAARWMGLAVLVPPAVFGCVAELYRHLAARPTVHRVALLALELGFIILLFLMDPAGGSRGARPASRAPVVPSPVELRLRTNAPLTLLTRPRTQSLPCGICRIVALALAHPSQDSPALLRFCPKCGRDVTADVPASGRGASR